MSWRGSVAGKLMSADEAVAVVDSRQRVAVAAATSTPFTLCKALYRRRAALRDVRIDHPGGFFAWVRPGEPSPFRVYDAFGTAANREMLNHGRIEYVPIARWRSDELPEGLLGEADVFLVPVSPPDRNGLCSFGSGVWLSPRMAAYAKVVVGEVHEEFIRTGGHNVIAVAHIDRLCEALPRTQPAAPTRDGGETAAGRGNEGSKRGGETAEGRAINSVIAAIGTLVAELVRDGDTLQIGTGTVSGVLAEYLGAKNDLGIQSELLTRGVARLVRDGVVTGRYKTLHRGKVVASACEGLSRDELALIDGNPVFELYDFGYTNDVRMLVRHDHLVAINNALLVDLTGQVAAETIGPHVWSGPGGQTAFMIAAQYSRGGRSVVVVPSTHGAGAGRRSRIVAALPEGTVVTVPRTFVDYVVTEHGFASLRGKSVRERIGELVTIAHPDFRAALRTEARALYGV